MKPTMAMLDEAKYLKPDEAAHLKRYLDDETAAALARGSRLRLRNATLGLFLLGTGLRVSEAVAVMVEDLALKGVRRFVRVRHGRSREGKSGRRHEGLYGIHQEWCELQGRSSLYGKIRQVLDDRRRELGGDPKPERQDLPVHGLHPDNHRNGKGWLQ